MIPLYCTGNTEYKNDPIKLYRKHRIQERYHYIVQETQNTRTIPLYCTGNTEYKNDPIILYRKHRIQERYH